MDDRVQAVRSYLTGLQQRITTAFGNLDGTPFRADAWRKEPGEPLQGEGVTMILTSHILAELQERVDRLAILAAGKVQALGSVQGLREQMALPLRVEVRTTPAGQACLEQALAALPVSAARWQDGQLQARCPRSAKMPLLAALAGLGNNVLDFALHEPSLEDVFFGCAD